VADGPESSTTLCLEEFARWQYQLAAFGRVVQNAAPRRSLPSTISLFVYTISCWWYEASSYVADILC